MRIEFKKPIFVGFIFAIYFTNSFGQAKAKETPEAYRHKEKLTTVNSNKDRVLNEVKRLSESLTHYSQTAQADSFLGCYAETPDFLAVSADGVIRRYNDFKKICKEYYGSVKEQKITTIRELYNVLDDSTIVLCWSGNIDAFFKNGDIMKMTNYSVTYLLKKLNNEWKVIHSHESSLPPEIIKSK